MVARTRVPRLADPNIIIRIAESKREVEAANWLVFRNYVAEGYWDDDAKNLVENKWLHTPHRDVFVALLHGEVVGTVSIIRDSEAGLPSDAFQPTWLNYFRRSGDRLAEGSALAVEKNRTELKNLSLYLLTCYMQYSFYHMEVDRLVQACRSNHADFYADVLRFEKIGGIVYNNYARVPAQLLSLHLVDAHQVLSDHYERDRRGHHNFYRFLMVDEHPNIQFPDPCTMYRSRQRDWAAYARLRQATERRRQIVDLEHRRFVANTAVRT